MQRLWRFSLWSVASLLTIFAILVTSFRVLLPHLSHFQNDITRWVNDATGLEFQATSISGYWNNLHPYISLTGFTARLPDGSKVKLSAEDIDIEFNLVQSLLKAQPIVADLKVNGMDLDIRSVKLHSSSSVKPAHESEGQSFIRTLDHLLLRQLDGFTLKNSTIYYQSMDGGTRELNINSLKWANHGSKHRFQGLVSVASTQINSLHVNANFVDHGSLSNVSGEFYVAANNIQVAPWLSEHLKLETGIEQGQASFKSWLTLTESKPVQALVELGPSHLVWKNSTTHRLDIQSGVFNLFPQEKGWKAVGQSFAIKTDDKKWPKLEMALDWQPNSWHLNVSQLDISTISPLIKLLPGTESTDKLLTKVSPGGVLSDIRVQMGKNLDSLKYSAELTNGSMKQWYLLPEVNHLEAAIAGDAQKAVVNADLQNDELPYGDVFQAPLDIKNGHVRIVWQREHNGWALWSNDVDVSTPYLDALGEFRLDVPNNQSPLLSFYSEASLNNAGETWRYLPTLALGHGLTDYLSKAIQAGKVDNAQLLWYGRLADFPYSKHDGIFQASVKLKDAKFGFDTKWPAITDLNLNLLFQNDSMYFDSNQASLKGVKAVSLQGSIPEFAADGRLKIKAKVVGQGNAVRDYMTATPLVDSVGAALTTIQINGQVKSDFQLDIPLNGDKAHVWGYADLHDNQVHVQTPAMDLHSVTGRINFDNDVVNSKKLTATLLDQPISLNFDGENGSKAYDVKIHLDGNWKVKPLAPYVGQRWTSRLSGNAPWDAQVDIQLKDTGFTYQINGLADLKTVTSEYPYPLTKASGVNGRAKLEVSGNQESISARLAIPNLKYQTEIDIRKDVPILKSNYVVVGKGNYKVSPVVGNSVVVRTDKFDLDKWLDILFPSDSKTTAKKNAANKSSEIEIPTPQKITLDVKNLKFATLDWHDVKFTAKKKVLSWYMQLNSLEAKGEANYIDPYDLTVSLDRLQIYVPSLETSENKNNRTLFETAHEKNQPLISSFDRSFHKLVPNITLAIKDFWFQGYRVGQVHLDLQRQGDKLEWKNLTLKSGANQVNASGYWLLTGDKSQTHFNIAVKGENNSDVMERFGITSGIQQAPFNISSSVTWDGAPWSMRVNTLNGTVNTKLGKGVIPNVSGAANLLGLFSLDSIIRKMQLDFTGVFDKGMAFDSITGTGNIKDGVFVTNDIKMDAVAGVMKIKGLANLNTETVDAEVNFTPDITSGIPVLSAFAVTPVTALYVLAVTTVISPVIEVFTQVNYSVKGPLNNPKVKEISRSKGEFKLPEKLLDEVK
nr:YhdP family protein [Vibrio sinus]